MLASLGKSRLTSTLSFICPYSKAKAITTGSRIAAFATTSTGDEIMRLNFTTQLQKLQNGPEQEIVFASSLSKKERKVLHMVSEELGLHSKSHGQGENRKITVSKETQEDENVANKKGFRKKILRKQYREVIQRMRKVNEEHEVKAKALGLDWRIVCATVLHRYPTITPANEPWEEAQYNMEERMAEKQREWLMDQLGDTDANFIGDENPSYDEILASMPFEPASRESQADIDGDMRSMERKQDKSSFLLVKRNRDSHVWQFPQGKLNTEKDGDSGRKAAERIIDRAVGNVHRYFISNAPIGHFCYAYPPQIQEQRGQYGAKVYFWRCQLIEGTVKLETRLYKDYAWITREEIEKYIEDEDTRLFLASVLPH